MCPRTLCHSGSQGTINEGTFFDKTLEVYVFFVMQMDIRFISGQDQGPLEI